MLISYLQDGISSLFSRKKLQRYIETHFAAATVCCLFSAQGRPVNTQQVVPAATTLDTEFFDLQQQLGQLCAAVVTIS